MKKPRWRKVLKANGWKRQGFTHNGLVNYIHKDHPNQLGVVHLWKPQGEIILSRTGVEMIKRTNLYIDSMELDKSKWFYGHNI